MKNNVLKVGIRRTHLLKNRNNSYQQVNYDLDINDIFDTSGIKSSKWWQGLSLYTPDAVKTLKDYISRMIDTGSAGRTAKTCPGIKTYLDNCVVLRSPVDFGIKINVNDDGSYTWRWIAPQPALGEIDGHPQDQYISIESKLFKDKINIKFCFPVTLSGNVDLLFLDPYYHDQSPFQAAPGLIKLNNDYMDLNVNTMVDKKNGLYHIKKGQALAYIYCPNIKIVEDESIAYRPHTRSTFFNTFVKK